MDLIKVLKKFARKIVGWVLIILSPFFFVTTFFFLLRGDFGPFITGLLLSFLLFALGLQIQTDTEKIKERINALVVKYFPQCPICKSGSGYEIRGVLPSSQYVRCKNCGAEWTSNDFIGYRDLRSMKLWKPPADPKVYAEYISESPLRPKRTYATKLWRALMNKEEMSLPAQTSEISLSARIKGIRLDDFVSSYKRCLAISFGTSLVLTTAGFYGFSVSMGDAYILFWASFFAMLFGLILLRR